MGGGWRNASPSKSRRDNLHPPHKEAGGEESWAWRRPELPCYDNQGSHER